MPLRVLESKPAKPWLERRPPLAETPRRVGFRRKPMTMIVEKQLRGSMAFDWRNDGLQCRMELPEQHIVVGPASFGLDDGVP